MAATKSASASRRSGRKADSWLSHRHLIAVEAMLVMGVLKDIIFDLVKKSGHPNYIKVILIMGATVGLFGGLLFVIEKLTARGVAGTHQALKQLPVMLPTLLVHAVLLFLLFLLYARMQNLKVF
jgi:hypothetical protein